MFSSLCENKIRARPDTVREVSVLAREHAADQREVDAARKLIDIQERERHLQVLRLYLQYYGRNRTNKLARKLFDYT